MTTSKLPRPIGQEWGTTAWTATARIAFRCQEYPGCRGRRLVQPGEKYARLVAFPGHDAVSGTRPWVLRLCEACATQYGKAMPPTMRERRAAQREASR